ncbi:MAG: hypothetical protein JRI68_06415 [Deltaproteobacteria bacterium]|nr:hypothetical protein [Deltaproteobacteria bacterium]
MTIQTFQWGRRLAAWLLGAVLSATTVAGCQDKPRGKPAATTSAASAAAAPTAAPLGPKPSGAPELAGSQVRVELASGVTLTLPASATKQESGTSKALQSVGRSQLFQLDQPGHLLSISEVSPTEQACPERLETQWQRLRKSTHDTDPRRLALRTVAVAEDRKVGGARVLYSEAQQRDPGATDAGRRSAAVASVVFCAKNDLVMVVLVCDQPKLPGGSKAMLESIAASGLSSP